MTHLQQNNTIPKGYKQTEIAVIPEDWEVILINDIVKKIGDGIHSTPKYVLNGNFYFINGNNLVDGYIKFYEETNTVDIAEYKKHSRELNNQTILLSINGTIGNVAFYKDESIVLGKSVAYINVINIFSKVFLYYVIQTSYVQSFFESNLTGSTIRNLGLKTIRNTPILIPPTIQEQQAIAQVLSDTDRCIESIAQLIAKKKAIKQGAMQELLTGKKRLADFSGKWETKKLGEVAFIKTGSKNNQDKVVDGYYPFFVRSQSIEKINSYSYDCEAILVPGEGGIGSIFHYINGKFDVHQRVYVISNFSENIYGKYVYLFMKEHFGMHAMKNTVKATVDSLRLPTFKEFEIKLPNDIQEQQAIARILSDMDAEIEALTAQLHKTKALKQGLMQELLTGKTRLV